MQRFWTFVWNVSEFTGIRLGRYAPFVFGKMIGSDGEQIDDLGNRIDK